MPLLCPRNLGHILQETNKGTSQYTATCSTCNIEIKLCGSGSTQNPDYVGFVIWYLLINKLSGLSAFGLYNRTNNWWTGDWKTAEEGSWQYAQAIRRPLWTQPGYQPT